MSTQYLNTTDVPRGNGQLPKQGVIADGNVFGSGQAERQHKTIGYSGITYESPFTESAIPPFASSGRSMCTQVVRPATTTVGPAGSTTNQVQAQKVQPEHGTRLAKVKKQNVVQRAGGPSPSTDTPFHPQSKAKTLKQQRQAATPNLPTMKVASTAVVGSFASHGAGAVGTLSSRPNMDRYGMPRTSQGGVSRVQLKKPPVPQGTPNTPNNPPNPAS